MPGHLDPHAECCFDVLQHGIQGASRGRDVCYGDVHQVRKRQQCVSCSVSALDRMLQLLSIRNDVQSTAAMTADSQHDVDVPEKLCSARLKISRRC
jgi:hypothetical protein